MSRESVFSIELETRDYECDLQGIVNNAVYFNYFEHTRHQFLREVGLNFSELHEAGTDPVLARAEVDYKMSLRSQDRFTSELKVSRHGAMQMVFYQTLYRLPDRVLVAKSTNYVVFVRNGRPIRLPAEVDSAVGDWWSE